MGQENQPLNCVTIWSADNDTIKKMVESMLEPYSLTISNMTVVDSLLLLTYHLTVISLPLCKLLLSPFSLSNYGTLRSRLNSLVKKEYLTSSFVYMHQANITGNPHSSLYYLTDAGCDYLYDRFNLPELAKWNHTSASRCMHDYEITLSLLQILYHRVYFGKNNDYIPSFFENAIDSFGREYDMSLVSYSSEREAIIQPTDKLITDAIYTINTQVPLARMFQMDDFSRAYLYDSGKPKQTEHHAPKLPIRILLEQDMDTERPTVLLEKLAKYAELSFFSRDGSFGYDDTCILFSCFSKAPLCNESWNLSDRNIDLLIKRASDTVPLREEFASLITDCPAELQDAYLQINNFYPAGDCASAKDVLERFLTEKKEQRNAMIHQYDAKYQIKKYRKRIADVYNQIADVLLTYEPEIDISLCKDNASLVASEFLRGMRCYFLPTATLSQSSERLVFNPDYYAWYASKYFAEQFRNSVPFGLMSAVEIKVYNQMPPQLQMRMPTGLYLALTNVVTISLIRNEDEIFSFDNRDKQLILAFEDLSDLGSWVRIQQFFKYFPNGYGQVRLVALYDSEADIVNFVKATGLSLMINDGCSLIDSPKGLEFIPRSKYYEKCDTDVELFKGDCTAYHANGTVVIKALYPTKA